MRKTAPLLLMLGFLLIGTAAFAGNIDYLSNQSVEYLMNLNRNGATDAADIATYNPAGLVFLPKDGMYINSSYQYIYLRFSESYRGQRFEQDQPNPIPALFTVYKKDNLAAFLAVNITAGGGWVKWKEGDATTAQLIESTGIGAAGTVNQLVSGAGGTGATTVNESFIEGYSAYIGIMAGLAYKLNDKISVSAAPRYIIAERKAAAFADFTVDAIGPVPGNETRIVADDNFDYNARGLGGVFGLDIKPTDNLNFGIRYETVTKLNFKYSKNRRDVAVTGPNPALNAGLGAELTAGLAALDKDGQTVRYDLPAVLGVGVDFAVTPDFHLLSSANYYFIENAVWENVRSSDVTNGWEVGIGTTFKPVPRLKVGTGYQYTVQGEKTDALNNENPGLNSHAVALGFSFAATPNLDLKLASEYTRYVKDSKTVTVQVGGIPIRDVDIDYKKIVTVISAGFEYRFDM
jgi:long-chain fatty acid transport protein